MKKILFLVVLTCFLVSGCGKMSQKDIVKEFIQKIESSDGYVSAGKLTVRNNDEVYEYQVDVSNWKDNYKVVLTNLANQHSQVIVKNSDGVYVLTPSLNKSFRFQSDWPYQNSQVYLLNALARDLGSEEDREFTEKEDSYVFMTNVHYSNNHKLVRQKIILSKKGKPEKVIVYDDDGVEAMTMIYEKIDYSPSLSEEDFDVQSIMQNRSDETFQEVSNLEDIIYPLYIPDGTKLVSEEKIAKENGERVLMNYDGEKSFLLVEETADVFHDFTIIPSSGEPCLLMDTMGVVTDNSLSWTSGGVEFYIVSDVMSQDEMMEVAQSISGIVSMK